MDSLEKQLLLRDIEKYGYFLVQSENTPPQMVLTQMVSAADARVLEGVPVVLTNMMMKNQKLSLVQVESELPKGLQLRFRMLVAVTYLFLFWVPESEAVRKVLHKYLKEREPSLLESVKEKLQNRTELTIGGGARLDVERLENTYKSYVVSQFMETQTSLAKKLEDSREAALQHALAELFTEKQRSLMLKMVQHEPLTKTDKEYYSRVVKPRLKALRNQELQSLATTLLGY